MAELVTVASFSTSHEAALAKAQLEEHGIHAYVHGENNARLFGGLGALAGSINVQVNSDDKDAARSVLSLDMSGYDEFLTTLEAENTDPDIAESMPAGLNCPRCRSDNLIVQPYSFGMLALGILFLGIPLLFMKRRHQCAICGMTWNV